MRSKLKNVRTYTQLLRTGSSDAYLYHLVRTKAHKLEAQKLHSATYLYRGFVEAWEVGADGIITLESDPHQKHSRYFVVRESKKPHRVVVTARQIRANSHGMASFPLMTQANLYPMASDLVSKYEPNKCVEISGLAKASGISSYATLLMYRQMWQYSYKRGEQLWLMACDVKLYERLKLLFGDAITQIGDVTSYKGGDVVPAALDIKRSVKDLKASAKTIKPFERGLKKNLLRFFLEGL